MQKRKWNVHTVKFWLFAIFFISMFILIPFFGVLNINETTVQTFIQNHQYFPKVIFFLLMTIAVATTLPVNIVALAGFFLFNFYELLILTSLAIIVGIFLMYILAKEMGQKGFEQYAGVKGTKTHLLHKLIKKHRYQLMTVLSFVYFLPSNMGGLTAAFTGTGFKKFFWIGFTGNAINILFFITLLKGIAIGSLALTVFSGAVLVANSLIPICLYRRYLKVILSVVFNKSPILKVLPKN